MHSISITLIGMGDDGAVSLKQLIMCRITTFAQDEDSSVIFGMPKEAIKNNAAEFVGSPKEIREILLEQIENSQKKLKKA